MMSVARMAAGRETLGQARSTRPGLTQIVTTPKIQGEGRLFGAPASPVEGYVKLENHLGASSNAERRLRSFLKYLPERCLEDGDSKPLTLASRQITTTGKEQLLALWSLRSAIAISWLSALVNSLRETQLRTRLAAGKTFLKV